MNTPRQYRSSLLLSLLALALVVAGCSASDGANTQDPQAPAAEATTKRVVRVETLLLEPNTFEDVVELTGAVEAPNDAILSAQTTGTLVRLAPLGRAMSRGQVVAALDQDLVRTAITQGEAQVASAEAQFNLAQDNFNRQEPLFRDSIISALEFENVRAQLNQAEAQLNQFKALLEQAKEQREAYDLKAPFNGVVEERFAEVGEQLTPGTPIARLVDTRQVKVTAGVPERYARDIRRGTPVEIQFQAYGVESRTGRVAFVGSVINPNNRTFSIEIELDNRDGSLKPEMIASVYVTRAELADQIVVPQTAVLRDEFGVSMFVATRDGEEITAERRTVELGPSYAGLAVVESGLASGDEVIIVGQTKVTEGDALEIVRQALTLSPPTD